MKNKLLIDKIKVAAKEDEKKRKDIRYIQAMAFLVKKGFLKANADFAQYYKARVNLNHMIWAGQNVEPRILEVLPAAVARLPKSFILDGAKEILQLQKIVNQLNQNLDRGDDFFNMPYHKLKQWMNLPLKDHRTKIKQDKKLVKTFRLNLEAIQKIKLLKLKDGVSEATVLERLLAKEPA